MKDEAAANAAADAKEKERIDKLNQADTMIFQTEKQLQELGDKIPADKKATIETALEKLKEAHKAQDLAGIDSAITEIQSAFAAAQQDILNAQQAQGAEGQQGPSAGAPNAGGSSDSHVDDVEFEEVK